METDEEGVAVDDECRNCRFYNSEEYEVDDIPYDKGYGICLRYPPKRIDGSASGFPVVEDDWWCGEHQKKFASDVK